MTTRKSLNPDWERAAVMELSREHEAAFYMYKVNLRPIAITLFDSDSVWGMFDPSTRTISISRKLVLEHLWHHVLGIFRHEMAHQLVSEQARSGDRDPKAHGEEFRLACTRLGIPAHFARAEVDLQSCPLDWRTEKSSEASEKILDRIKKLLALANSTNENEALLAMERVREIYAKYNLEHMSEQARKNFVHLVITHGKKRMEAWEQRTISILIEHFFVKVLTFQQFDKFTGERVHALEIIGTRENVLMAEYVYHFLLQQVEFLLAQTLQSDLKLYRSEKKSFRLGVLAGFAKKLSSGEKATRTDRVSPVLSTGLSIVGEALQKFRESPELDDYLSTAYPKLSNRASASFKIDSEAFAAGRAAGHSITLNKPLASDPKSRGKLLKF